MFGSGLQGRMGSILVTRGGVVGAEVGLRAAPGVCGDTRPALVYENMLIWFLLTGHNLLFSFA